jgi:predicted membrane protein (TIGR00267 family)
LIADRLPGVLVPQPSPRLLLLIRRSSAIARRYLVTNGFDGTLTMLGLIMGFRTVGQVPVQVALTACTGAAVALAVSGISSAYVSERAERQRELAMLQQAMLDGLDDSAHAHTARWAPVVIAIVNGLAPFLLAQIVMLPLWLAGFGATLPLSPYDLSIAIAFLLIMLLGVFSGRISGVFWLWAGLRTLLIGVVTAAIIYLLSL